MKLYNTLSRKEEKFEPLNSSEVTFYACGPTVYDETHIGHMRKFVMDDVLKKAIRFAGFPVKHVMNITDVGHLSGDDDSGEDKLEKGAKKQGKTVWDIAKDYTEKFFETMEALNVETPTIVCNATDHIQQMIELIQKLEEKGFTYKTKEAIYFDVTKFNHYGELSGQKLEEKMQAVREEVQVDPNKKHPADFALWFKRVGRFADHTMHWQSPWGDGFPGWHIECSAMSMHYLGETIDIHSGGIDHIPVHHENEIAQSEAATGKKFVDYWVHHAFLKVNGEKMSKSKGNFYTLKDIQDHGIDPLAIRYLFLQTNYRKELNFTWEAAKAAEEAFNRLKNIVIDLKLEIGNSRIQQKELGHSPFLEKFKKSVANDLNTAEAVAVMWEVLKSDITASEKLDLLYKFDEVFGLKMNEFQSEAIPEEILKLAEERLLAKKDRDFEKSDQLRITIEKLGYVIEDTTNNSYKIRSKSNSAWANILGIDEQMG